MKKHRKHTKLTRPDLGEFGRNEWAILGTPCGVIQNLAFKLIEAFSSQYKMAYVDADHKTEDAQTETQTARAYGANLSYTDKIGWHQFDMQGEFNSFQWRRHFNEQDVILVNGNHFKAAQQIVVIDPKKTKSLQRKLDRLTNVQLILFVEGSTEIPDYLTEYLPNITTIPQISISDSELITNFLREQFKQKMAPLAALVLAGGKSLRMGQDKGKLYYHDKPQREHIADVLSELCQEVYLSCRAEQVTDIQSDYPLILDSFLNLGPFGAIVSAFREKPNHAWLVVACDLPLLNKETLKTLIQHRNPSKIATAFHNPETNFPEPLITIWEAKSYLVLLQFLTQGYSCPRKVLINSDVEIVNLDNYTALKNVNTPEDFTDVMDLLGRDSVDGRR